MSYWFEIFPAIRCYYLDCFSFYFQSFKLADIILKFQIPSSRVPGNTTEAEL